ncbi:hypothetical protein [Streptomyces clavuligerus]|uniref:Secreted protein n=1 Tax=Streptomyces clavuligerus TaxID=1901 RepID=B5GM77_STRCL|nr:hypothetical protein [Streptomyces clavuligerus]ANW22313.1 hypothetical protein BB341_28695 [Streptomyces clavuligerus]EDY47423.1 hypothetical protein SSCG_00451 [Streptomyces clavuligerus]EFG04387.1 Hypothetical protein SCLAV_p0900 [Streptomyces clavuligerus]MBY6307146.1 hypothetical protein [Streptomyces clavuligerus]QPL67193.1 hypothetical protein I3J04_30035 [Streptomyces clavuligerus]
MATRRGFIGAASAVGAASFLAAQASPASAAPSGIQPVTEREARDSMLSVNREMRLNYAALKADLIKHLSPVVVVQNDAKGGRFTLVHKGTLTTENPVSETFELAKSISHVPLGIFSVIAPYLSSQVPNLPNASRIDPHDLRMVAFKGNSTTGWITPLQGYAASLLTARDHIKSANIPADMAAGCTALLNAALKFIDDSTLAKSFDMKSFEDFSGSVYPNIRTNMKHASAAQIAGVQDVMKRWRAKIGETEWKDLYCVVLSQWTTSVLNQNSIIIKPCMNPAKVATHLIDLPAVEPPKDPIFVALDNLARIVQDNIAAEMVFPVDAKVADALKGQQDLLSDEILIQMGETTPGGARTASTAGAALASGAADACPFHEKAMRI